MNQLKSFPTKFREWFHSVVVSQPSCWMMLIRRMHRAPQSCGTTTKKSVVQKSQTSSAPVRPNAKTFSRVYCFRNSPLPASAPSAARRRTCSGPATFGKWTRLSRFHLKRTCSGAAQSGCPSSSKWWCTRLCDGIFGRNRKEPAERQQIAPDRVQALRLEHALVERVVDDDGRKERKRARGSEKDDVSARGHEEHRHEERVIRRDGRHLANVRRVLHPEDALQHTRVLQKVRQISQCEPTVARK